MFLKTLQAMLREDLSHQNMKMIDCYRKKERKMLMA